MVNHTGNANLSLVIRYTDSNNKYKIRRVFTSDDVKIKIYEEDISEKFNWNGILQFRNSKTRKDLDTLNKDEICQYSRKKIQVYCGENESANIEHHNELSNGKL